MPAFAFGEAGARFARRGPYPFRNRDSLSGFPAGPLFSQARETAAVTK
jgi:hypothetical protein